MADESLLKLICLHLLKMHLYYPCLSTIGRFLGPKGWPLDRIKTNHDVGCIVHLLLYYDHKLLIAIEVAEVMEEVLRQVRSKAAGLCKRPETFLEPQQRTFEGAKVLGKVLYECTRASEEDRLEGVMPELVVEGFDEEQVWAGVEMYNAASLRAMAEKVDELARKSDLAAADLLVGGGRKRKREKEKSEEEEVKKRKVRFDQDSEEDEKLEDEESEEPEEEDEDDPILNDPDFQNMSDSDGDDLPLFENARSDEEEEEEEEIRQVDEGTESYMAEAM